MLSQEQPETHGGIIRPLVADGDDFRYAMSLACRVRLNGMAFQDPSSRLLALVGDDIRGASAPTPTPGGHAVFELLFYSDISAGEKVRLVLEHGGQRTPTTFRAGFVAGVGIGSVDEPLTVDVASPPEPPSSRLPDAFALRQNAPDPFVDRTLIQYDLPRAAHVTLEVYSAAGREIGVLVDADQDAGRHEAYFDGSSLAPGAYQFRLKVGSFEAAHRMLLLAPGEPDFESRLRMR
jgi:hypothetical protein